MVPGRFNLATWMEMDVLVEEALYTLSYNPEKEWLHMIWAGEPDLASIKRGCLDMLSALKRCHCSKILSDARGVTQDWTEASEWTGTVWYPLMYAAGLKHLAFVQAASAECQLSIQLSLAYGNNPPLALCEDIEQARNWLSSRPC